MNRGKVVSSQDREGEPNFQEKRQNIFGFDFDIVFRSSE